MAPTTTAQRTGLSTAFLNLREGPDTTFKVKALLPPDTPLTIHEEQGEWYKVSTNGKEGFVHRNFVRLTTTAAKMGAATSALNLREGPDTTFAVKKVLAAGTRLTIVGEQGDWYQVKVDGQEGFVHRDFVAIGAQKIPRGFLIDVPELRNIPLAPSVTLKAPAGGSRNAGAAARIWNQYGGLVEALSARLKIDPAVGVAVVAAESGGRGMDKNGRMIIRFENHIFFGKWGAANPDAFNAHFRFNGTRKWEGHQFRSDPGSDWQDFHGNQDAEWRAFGVARSLDDRAAKLSISMGLPQIMGFNHAGIGYDSVDDMFQAFSADERNQLLGFFDFIQGAGTLSRRVIALQERNYVRFAALYNGAGQEALYGGIIQAMVDAFSTLVQS